MSNAQGRRSMPALEKYSALPNSSKKDTLRSGTLKAEWFSCVMVWFMLVSPSPWLT